VACHNVYIVKMFVVCMKKLGCLLVLLVMVSFVVGGISVLEPEDVYNLGDRLYVSADGIVGAESGNLDFNLVCANKTTILARLPATSFSADEESAWDFYKVLRLDDLAIVNYSDIVGECQIVTRVGASVVSSKVFTISDDVSVSVSLNQETYNPGEAVMVNIEAIKTNGDLLNGFVEGGNFSAFSKAIEGGAVSEVFSVPDTIEAGTYYMSVRAWDIGKSGVLNEGSAGVFFDVNQVVSSLVLSLDGEEVVPGESFSMGVEAYDQAGIEMNGAVGIRIVTPENVEIESVIQTGDFGDFNFELNSTAGIWRVIAKFDDVISEREFRMLEVQKAEFDFEESLLTVRNVGNSVYDRTINVEIGNETMVLDLEIGLGEVRKFNLAAPNGEYEVYVGDGEDSVSRQVLLTGNAISVKDLKDVGIFKGYSIVWIFLIVVIGGIGFILFRRYRRTKTIGPGRSQVTGHRSVLGRLFGGVGELKNKVHSKIPTKVRSRMDDSLNFTNKSPKIQGLDHGDSHEDKSMVDLTKNDVGVAESTLVLKGEKHLSAVVALSVKNYAELDSLAREALARAVGEVKKTKGLVDWRGDYIFVVFSPVVTKTYGNEALAAKAGFAILESLNEHNRKFKSKIVFSLGVHSGELVASKVKGKLKYTSIGNTISLAKRIADSEDGKLVVSDPIRRKLVRDLKVTRGKEIGDNATFVVSEVRDKAADKERLADLLKRQG